jgi:hypothetical protein
LSLVIKKISVVPTAYFFGKQMVYLVEPEIVVIFQYRGGDVVYKIRSPLPLILNTQLSSKITPRQLTISPDDGDQKPQFRLEFVELPIVVAAELMTVFRSPRSVRAPARIVGVSMMAV